MKFPTLPLCNLSTEISQKKKIWRACFFLLYQIAHQFARRGSRGSNGLGPCRWGTSAHADHAALLDADHAHQGLRLAPWRCTQKEQKKATEDSPYANNLIQGLDIIVRQILYRGFSIIGNRFRKTNRGSPAACSLSACYCLLGAVSCWTARLLSPKELGSNVMGWAVSLGGLYRLL